MSLPGHGRYEYVPITRRPKILWPGEKRLAVYIGLNLEHFSFGEGLGAELAPGGPQPDVLNYAWRDYGNRVGAWRMLDLLDELDMPATILANSAMYDYAPDLLAAFRTRGDEIAGHGRTNSERQSTMTEAQERAMITEATQTLLKAEGTPPKGWLSPWIAESPVTPDLLVEAGYSYTLNWCMDDQPVWMKTRAGPLLSVPYPQELNDIPAIVARKDSASEFADMIIDTCDEMLQQSANQSLVMGIALHPYIVGQPFRLRHLRRALAHVASRRDEIWLTQAAEIASHWTRTMPPEGDHLL
ncbi:peptidoglycan/xylan/chitin deacetylase (PgdA/CDA1 family) [Sagittula marina]|uniref:Chitooligosaccharide deacetylase n=1 Tax=Sagittula marina TaxID=943940 RepID=A0A7W6GRQ8_9RHOB|nr:polysaccharide deacetylase family protein [Sagittula marina]MBB3985606.1 peptidoglycan/xylan/chitin deacetylase (PgdA/CDA1 family) [Sagittula marina]